MSGGVQPETGAVAHWLATQVACRHASAGAGQSAAVLQQPLAPVDTKTHMLLAQAIAVWQALAGVQSPVELQHGDAPLAVKPQSPALHVAVWQAFPDGQAVHIVPQLMTLVSDLQVPEQSWKVALHV
jgi:hypothetical protein